MSRAKPVLILDSAFAPTGHKVALELLKTISLVIEACKAASAIKKAK